MGYRVRTPDGELGYPSLGDVERAYAQGLVGPEDEVIEEGKSAWRKASSIPALARSRPEPRGIARQAQFLNILAIVALSVGALVFIGSESSSRRMVGVVLALVVGSLLTRVTYKAFNQGRKRG